jgi:large-conductance mechanosensitive channel
MRQLCRDPLRTLAIANGANRLSLAAGLVAGVAYSTFASFVANALTPVSGRLIELDSFRRTVSGRYQEVLSLNGVMFTVMGSLVVFALVWLMMRVTLEHWRRVKTGRILSCPNPPSPMRFSINRELAPSVSRVSR